MFEFLRNMWIMRRVDEAKIAEQVTKGRITQEQADEILNTPQTKEK